MRPYGELSIHDKEILEKIEHLDRYGYTQWTEISYLANQLEDEEYKAAWNRRCAHYNHMEEASIGAL